MNAVVSILKDLNKKIDFASAFTGYSAIHIAF